MSTRNNGHIVHTLGKTYSPFVWQEINEHGINRNIIHCNFVHNSIRHVILIIVIQPTYIHGVNEVYVASEDIIVVKNNNNHRFCKVAHIVNVRVNDVVQFTIGYNTHVNDNQRLCVAYCTNFHH